MSPLEAIIQLLVLPPEDANSTRAWLRLVALNVQGFATQPEVVRRYTNSSGMRAEVRRWSEGVYLPLTVKKATKAEGALFLGQDGRVFSRKLDGRRFLRNDPGDRIADEIYEYIQVDSITANHLAIAQKRAVMHLLPIGYANWDKLPSQQRISLVQFGGSWPNAQAALESVSGNE
ncbi:hypothetical protein IJT17_08860, partial [bacterium]|nr:hypothetical protein [bacterium]